MHLLEFKYFFSAFKYTFFFPPGWQSGIGKLKTHSLREDEEKGNIIPLCIDRNSIVYLSHQMSWR